MKSGPIILIEDDADDKDIFQEVLNELRIDNKLVWFTNCLDAFKYLQNTSDQPFMIFSDVNLPGLNGIEFKKQIDADPALRKKSIPFMFYSTSVDPDTVNEAYTEMTVQGYFQKEDEYNKIRDNIKLIVDYWMTCRHPNIEPA